jgi:uncharacterized C2H2 Zn-finger protein
MLDDADREPSPHTGPKLEAELARLKALKEVERLTKEVERVMRIGSLFRQQRDDAARLANDLHVELAECRRELEQLTGA